jgi:hypothetical protein
MFAVVPPRPFVAVLNYIDTDTIHVLIFRKKMKREPHSEILYLLDLFFLSRQCIDGVFHRIGRQAQGVVAECVNLFKFTLERYLYGNVLNIVPVRAAKNL